MKQIRISIITLVMTLFVASVAFSGLTYEPSLENALKAAHKAQLPVLVKFGVDWSKESKVFDEAISSNPDIIKALKKNVILCILDASKEEGSQLAKYFKIMNYPSFILMDKDKETIDRWIGFGCQECFVKKLMSTLDDPITIQKRLKRYQSNPTESDAYFLGDYHHNKGLFAEAVAYYRRAMELNPDSEIDYNMHIFGSMAYGNFFQLFSNEDVKRQADILVKSDKRGAKQLLKLAYSMFKVAKRDNDITMAIPYIKVAVEETAKSQDDEVLKKRAHLLPEYTFYVLKDAKRAIAQKKEIQPDGWLEDCDLLNNFAWWCFENQINLKEAEKLGLKALSLAKSGIQKANVLDTIAEIMYSQGDVHEAVKYSRLALQENAKKNTEYFQKQLQRFEKLAE